MYEPEEKPLDAKEVEVVIQQQEDDRYADMADAED